MIIGRKEVLKLLVADALRALAERIDGRQVIDVTWHKANVVGMNRYIERTEARIKALEELVAKERVS
jgi:hypothetical protein